MHDVSEEGMDHSLELSVIETETGELEPQELVVDTIKPFVTGRKNWLFHGNDLGAKAGSTLFSLIETCKQNKIETFSWFKYVLTHIR